MTLPTEFHQILVDARTYLRGVDRRLHELSPKYREQACYQAVRLPLAAVTDALGGVDHLLYLLLKEHAK